MMFQSPSPPPAPAPAQKSTVSSDFSSVINDALITQGLRYDLCLGAIVRQRDHAMTLRSHRNPASSIRMCYLRDMLTALREDVAEICFVQKNGTIGRMYAILTDHTTTGNICVSPVPLSQQNQPGRTPYHPDDPYDAWCKNACASCTAGQHVIEKNRLTLWDVQRSVWRSLNVDSILTVNRTLFKL